MKNIILGFAIVTVLLTACSNNSNDSHNTATKSTDTTQTNKQVANAAADQATSLDKVVNDYLQLKNALAKDNSDEAATAGKQLVDEMQKIDESSFTEDQKKIYGDVKDDIKEHAEHISTNEDKIAHQREHFDMLSKDMYDLVKAFKPSRTLYQDHCPMYNDGKGATWLSEVKEIKNPYLGKNMPDCGIVKEEIK